MYKALLARYAPSRPVSRWTLLGRGQFVFKLSRALLSHVADEGCGHGPVGATSRTEDTGSFGCPPATASRAATTSSLAAAVSIAPATAVGAPITPLLPAAAGGAEPNELSAEELMALFMPFFIFIPFLSGSLPPSV